MYEIEGEKYNCLGLKELNKVVFNNFIIKNNDYKL